MLAILGPVGKNLGMATVQQRFESPREILGNRLREGSIYRLLADPVERSGPGVEVGKNPIPRHRRIGRIEESL